MLMSVIENDAVKRLTFLLSMVLFFVFL